MKTINNILDKDHINITPIMSYTTPFSTYVILLTLPCVTPIPRFDPTALLHNVLVPADAAIGTVIYRLRASDPLFDYPLDWQLVGVGRDDGEQGPIGGGGATAVIQVDALNCTRFNSVCQANVVLKRRLEPGRFYDFRIMVTSSRATFTNSLDCSFRATNATTAINEIFPGAPTLLMISESARRNTELGTLLAKGNPQRERPVLLELWGSPEFSLRQRVVNNRDAEGTVLLLGKLDYERRTVHHLTILANDPYTDMSSDTRNIAVWPLLVAVLDEQDTPPVFTQAPPTTVLPPGLHVGDVVLTVRAEDGDRGQPRDIRYSLQQYGNPYMGYFSIGEDTGELRLTKPVSDIQAMAHSNTPIILTVIAEEVRSAAEELPAQTSSVQLALIPPPPIGSSPRFSAREYHTNLDENAQPGTLLNLTGAELVTQPGLVFALELRNNNDTFDVSPNVVEGRSRFTIKVRDNKYLDYEERRTVQCEIIAREVGDNSRNLTVAVAKLFVHLNDINDNPPVFRESQYIIELKENPEIGAHVTKIEATDIDGKRNNIKYTKLIGTLSGAFKLDQTTGIITVVNPQLLDAEESPEIQLQVEATDDNGLGNSATVDIIIKLIDINDMVPQFEKPLYEFILKENQRSFTVPAFIKATDADLSAPNNLIKYEIIEPIDSLTLDSDTGELILRGLWTRTDVTSLRARAYDGGIPRLWSECEIRIYQPDGLTRRMLFIVSGSNPDRRSTEEYLSTIAGGKVQINEIRPYTGREEHAYDFSEGGERSVVFTTVTYTKDSVIDLKRIQETLDQHSRQRQQQREEVIKSSSSGSLWWLLLVILLLLFLLVLLVFICCVLEGCPLYVAPKKKRKVASAEQLVVKVNEPGAGTESKSVQVAEWFGRREAWTPEGHLLDADIDSLRRHELERGSDRGARRAAADRLAAGPKTYQQPEPRDQLYIREGNADILRLITRGGGEPQLTQRPVTLVQDQYVIDSGKDILLRRFIDQQHADVAARQSYILPNAVTRLQNENELLEESLRQQNALLRQMLLDREREIRLETQSLPAGTQTDQNVSTQTEPLFLRPPRRQTRSDNDQSDGSDEDEKLNLPRSSANGRRRRIIQKKPARRKITTPIQEESDNNMETVEMQQSAVTTGHNEARLRYAHTKTSLLRKKVVDSAKSKSSSRSKGSIKQEVLREISDSLGPSTNSDERKETDDMEIENDVNFFSEDSLEDETPRQQRYHSALDLRPQKEVLTRQSSIIKSQSQTDLIKLIPPPVKFRRKSSARYMEWYNKQGSAPTKKPSNSKQDIPTASKIPVPTNTRPPGTASTKITKRHISEKEPTESRRMIELPLAPGPVHPLIQHSKNRFEVNVMPAPQIRRMDEDVDSGIVLSRPSMAEKRSVFTIAYADMRTKKIPDVVITP